MTDLTKLGERLDNLPKTMSGLLELALSDLKKQETAENSEVCMGLWLAETNGNQPICMACLAGSVMRFSLDLMPVSGGSDFCADLAIADAAFADLRQRFWELARALDGARNGSFSSLAGYFGVLADARYLRFRAWWRAQRPDDALLLSYHCDRTEWWLHMYSVVNKLKELGL